MTKKIESEISQLPNKDDEDDEDWAVDTSETAVAERMKELAVQGAVAKLMKEGEDELQGKISFFFL